MCTTTMSAEEFERRYLDKFVELMVERGHPSEEALKVAKIKYAQCPYEDIDSELADDPEGCAEADLEDWSEGDDEDEGLDWDDDCDDDDWDDDEEEDDDDYGDDEEEQGFPFGRYGR